MSDLVRSVSDFVKTMGKESCITGITTLDCDVNEGADPAQKVAVDYFIHWY